MKNVFKSLFILLFIFLFSYNNVYAISNENNISNSLLGEYENNLLETELNESSDYVFENSCEDEFNRIKNEIASIYVYEGYNKILPFNCSLNDEEKIEFSIVNKNGEPDNSKASINEESKEIVYVSSGEVGLKVKYKTEENTIPIYLEKDLIKINNADEFVNELTNSMEDGNRKGYKLTSSITLESSNNDYSFIDTFYGTLDANGYDIIIKNSYKMLFNNLINANINNLVLTGDLDDYYNYDFESFGNLASRALFSNILNIGNTISRRCSKNLGYSCPANAGGLIGELNHSVLKSSYNSGLVWLGKFAGGIVGKSENSLLENVFNVGNIYAVEQGFSAGIVGNSEKTTINNSYNIGWVYEFSQNISSISSGVDNIINNAYTLEWLPDAIKNDDNQLDNSVNNLKKMSLNEFLSKDMSLFDGFDFTNTWEISENYKVPMLKNIQFKDLEENITEYDGGNGMIWNPYRISNTEHFKNIDEGYSVILNNDLDFENENNMSPRSTDIFGIVFLGNNKTISNMNFVNNEKNVKYLGFFNELSYSYVNNFNLKNINIHNETPNISSTSSVPVGGLVVVLDNSIVEDVTIRTDKLYSSYSDVGGLAYKVTSSKIIDSHVENASKNSYIEGENVGGIAAIVKDSFISGCTSNIKISDRHYSNKLKNNYNSGGLVGNIVNSTISNSHNYGEVFINNNSDDNKKNFGGIVGYAKNSMLIDVHNEGKISSNFVVNVNIGGIGGELNDSSISNSYNFGNINSASSKNNSYVVNSGGLVGNVIGNVRITNSYNTANIENKLITENSRTAGLVGNIDSNNFKLLFSYNIGKVGGFGDTTFGLCGVSDCNISNSYYLEKQLFNMDTCQSLTDNDCKSINDKDLMYKNNEQMMSENTYVSWDFENVWEKVNDYPSLKSLSLIQMSDFDVEPNIVVNIDDQVKINVISDSVEPENTTIRKFSYKSLNEEVAIVDSNGIVTGLSHGKTSILVKTIDGSNLNKIVNVTVDGLEINNLNYSIDSYNGENKIYDKDGGDVLFDLILTGDESYENLSYEVKKQTYLDTNFIENLVLDVDENTIQNLEDGIKVPVKLTIPSGLDAGKYKMRIFDSTNDKDIKSNYLTFEIFEYEDLANISVPSKLDIAVGDSKKISLSYIPSNATNKKVSWKSDNAGTVSVDETSGIITALEKGKAIITVTSEDGSKTSQCVVTVHDQVFSLDNINFSPNTIYDISGGKINMKATLGNLSGSKVSVIYYKEGQDNIDDIVPQEFDVENNVADITLDIPKGIPYGKYIVRAKVVDTDLVSETEFEVMEYKKADIKLMYANENNDRIEISKQTGIVLMGSGEINIYADILNEDSTFKNDSVVQGDGITYKLQSNNIGVIGEDTGLFVYNGNVGKDKLVVSVGYEEFEYDVEVINPKVTHEVINTSSTIGNAMIDVNYGGVYKIVPYFDENINLDNLEDDLNVTVELIEISENESDEVKENEFYYKDKNYEGFYIEPKFDNDNNIYYELTYTRNGIGTVLPQVGGTYRLKYNLNVNDLYGTQIETYFDIELMPYFKVEALTLTNTEITLNSGEIKTLESTILPKNATNKNINWNSSNSDVVTVNSNTGEITALKKGEAIITATLEGKTSTCKVTVEDMIKLENVSSGSTEVYDLYGGKVNLIATLLGINEENVNVKLYKGETLKHDFGSFSVNDNITNIELDILRDYLDNLTDENKATYQIVVSAGAYTTSTNLEVKKYVEVDFDKLRVGCSYLLNKYDIDKSVGYVFGEYENLILLETEIGNESTFKDVKYSSEDSSIVEINVDGGMTVKKVGKTNVILEIGYETIKIPIEIIHNPKCSSITKISNIPGNSFIDNIKGGLFKFDVTFNNYLDYIVTNNDEENTVPIKVTYNGETIYNHGFELKYVQDEIDINKYYFELEYKYPNGIDVSVRSGSYKIFFDIKMNDTKKSTISPSIEVTLDEYKELKTIALSKTDIELVVNETININNLISFNPTDATNKNVTFESSDSSVIRVDDNGNITSLKDGNAIITVISQENVNIKSTINVTVEKNEYLEFSNKVNIYNESGSKYLKGFNANNTYKDLMNNIDTNLERVLKKSDGTKVTNDSSILETGMKLSIGNNTYDIVIKGDMSGDGKMSITDLSQMRYHLAKVSGKVKIGAYKQAGDMNDSNSVTITDLSQMRKKLAGVN